MSNLKQFMRATLEETAAGVVVMGDYDREAIEEAYPDQTFVFAAESQQEDAAKLADQLKICVIDPRGDAINRITEELIEEVKDEPNLVFVFTHTDELDEQEQHDMERVQALLKEAELPYYTSIDAALRHLDTE